MPILISALGSVIKGTRGRGNKSTRGNHPDYSVIKIDQNTEKSPGDSEETFYNSVKDHKLTLQ